MNADLEKKREEQAKFLVNFDSNKIDAYTTLNKGVISWNLWTTY